MGDLEAFLDDARRRVRDGFYAPTGEPLPPNGSLRDAVAGPAAVVAELKPRSPSRGRLLTGPPDRLLAAYKDGGAAALSVLTDADHFDGHPDLLRSAHATGLPVLMKDFVIDAAQIRCAAHHGASAVLLIERCFADPMDREALVQAACDAGLEVLLEIHTLEEWERAQGSAADLFGVNARDLDTLALDRDGARRAVQAVHAAGRRVVALSGVRDRQDREAAERDGADAVLVGTQLARDPHPALVLRGLRRPLAKVCGITDEAGLEAAAAAGADLVGLVVGAPDSPRDVPALQAQQLALAARDHGLVPVLVTPHEDAWEVREWCRLVRPDLVQLARLRPDDEWLHTLAAIPVTPLHVRGPDEPFPPDGGLVLDTPHPQGGGSGATHDWDATAARLAEARGRLSLVAGGLAAHNAAEALRVTGAWGADASSGLEASPGVKDSKKVRAFVAAVHGATPGVTA